MENQLSKLGDNSIQDLQAISESVKKYVDTENDATLQVALERINTKPNFWNRLFPNKFTREHDRMTIEKMQSVFTAKEQMFEIYTEVQLEIARQQGDALIQATGMQLRDQLTKFAKVKMDSMSLTMKQSRDEFVKRMKDQLKNVEEYRDFPELAEPYHQSLKDEISVYFSFIKELLESFQQALQTKVSELKSRG